VKPLLVKELRGVLPFMVLQAVLFLTGTVTDLFLRFPDQLSLEQVGGYTNPDFTDDYTMLAFLIAMTLSAGLIVGEKDRGTLEFLESLPTTRTRIFLAKMLAGWTVLAVAPLTEVSAAIALRPFSLTSLDEGFHLDVMAAGALCHACQLLLLFGLALNLAYLRRFAWLVAAVMISSYLALVDLFPALGVLDFSAMTEHVYEGTSRKLPITQLRVLLPLTAIFHVSAWALFAARADRVLVWFEGLREHRRGRAFLAIVGAASVIAWLVAIALIYGDEKKKEEKGEIPGATFEGPQRVRARTEHYRFTYESDRAARARRLIDVAERVHEEVLGRFEVEPIDLIEVDATVALAHHGMAGLADGKQLQIDLDAIASSTRAIEILAHETTHAYIAKASARRFGQAQTSTRFFNEGLAQVTGHEIATDTERLEEHALRAALMKHRKQLSLEVLLDDEELTRQHDENLAYSLGVELVSAVRDRWGPKAPYAIVRAMGRETAPEDLRGIVLWRDAFQAAGYDFDEALARFYGRLDRTRKKNARWIASVPRMQVVLQTEEGKHLVSAAFTPEPDTRDRGLLRWKEFGSALLLCRFRPKRDSSPSDIRTVYAEDDGTCAIRKDFFREGTVQVQFGLVQQRKLPLYEPWVEIRE
jgi:ABC-type transport system involved in multi-copper enzyme maturation permease subunit